MRLPPVPSARIGWSRGAHLLLWVHTGRARVHLDHQVHELAAGHGLWVPAHHRRRIDTAPGTVAFPYALAPDTVTAPAEPTRFEVRPEWHDRLIQHYVHFIAPVSSFGYTRASLLDVVGTAAGSPPLPTDPAARTVAEALLRDPTLKHTAEEWAALLACGARTLHREFVRGTGLTFGQWRTTCRLAVACELLDAGEPVGRVAERTGFAGRNGLTRAFRRHHGLTAREYRSRATGRAVVPPPGPPRSGLLAQVLREATGDRPLPATQTPPHVNDTHVLTWMYRGSGYLRIAGETLQLDRGDATWIPAGREHRFGTHTGSISLPLGHLDPNEVDLTEPLRARFPPSWEPYLLHRSVSARTPLRPADHDVRDILDLFHAQLSADRSRTVPMPRDARARAAAAEFLGRMRDPADTDPAVHEAFRRETGMSFARWRHVARMRAARELLADGTSPTTVARQVGYTQLSNFSRAFSRFHGEPPRAHARLTPEPSPRTR